MIVTFESSPANSDLSLFLRSFPVITGLNDSSVSSTSFLRGMETIDGIAIAAKNGSFVRFCAHDGGELISVLLRSLKSFRVCSGYHRSLLGYLGVETDSSAVHASFDLAKPIASVSFQII